MRGVLVGRPFRSWHTGATGWRTAEGECEVPAPSLPRFPSSPATIPEAVVPRRGGARPFGVPLARSTAPCSSHTRRRRSASASAAFRTASSSSCSCSRCSSADTRSSTSMPLVPDKLSSGRQGAGAGCGARGSSSAPGVPLPDFPGPRGGGGGTGTPPASPSTWAREGSAERRKSPPVSCPSPPPLSATAPWPCDLGEVPSSLRRF